MKPKTLVQTNPSDAIALDRIEPIRPLDATIPDTIYSRCVGYLYTCDTIDRRLDGSLKDKAIYLPKLACGYEYDIVKDEAGDFCLVVVRSGL